MLLCLLRRVVRFHLPQDVRLKLNLTIVMGQSAQACEVMSTARF
jgi:hypothetical protein